MQFDREEKVWKSHDNLRWCSADEATRSFARSLAEKISVHTHGTVALVQRSTRLQMFSLKIASQRCEVCGADPLDFLSSQLGNKFTSVETRGFGGERIHRHPGQFFRHTSYNSVTQLCMSFNFHQLARNVQILLSQIHTTQNFAWAGSTWVENVTTPTARSSGELPQVTKFSLVTRWSEAPNSPQTTQWSSRMQWTPASLRRAESMLWPRAMQNAEVMHGPATRQWLQSVQWSLTTQLKLARQFGQATGRIQRMDSQHSMVLPQPVQLSPSALLRPVAQSEQSQMIANVPGQAIVNTTYVRYVGNSVAAVPEVTDERWLRTATSQRHSGGTMVSFAPQRTVRDVRFAFAKRSDLLRFKQIDVAPHSLDASFPLIRETMLKTLNRSTLLANRSQFEIRLFKTKLFETKSFETRRFKHPALAPVTGEVSRNLRSVSELILVRKEGTSRAPSMAFVFAQPTRQKITEEHVVKRLEQPEIVDLVRKEVTQSMTRASPLRDLTREDYVEISDHVYSTLMKRLTAERERLGFR